MYWIRPIALAACAVIPSLTDAHSLDLLSETGAWELRNTEEGVMAVDEAEGVLEAQRRSYQSATALTREVFENFELEFEFYLEKWCELILLIHAPWNGADRAGLEVVLSDHHGHSPSPYSAGALLGTLAPPRIAVNDDGNWNTCRVLMDWPRFSLRINGHDVQDVDLSEHPGLRYKLRRGLIGFRDLLGWGFKVRNLELTRLPDTEDGIDMHKGPDPKGWREVRRGDARWVAEDGMISGVDGNGYLQFERMCRNFQLTFYYRTTPTANGGVFFRWMPDDSDRGNEIQILDVPQSLMPSASIYGISRSDASSLREGWNLMQVYVENNHAVTHLNGHRAAETDRLTKIRSGHITLQMHKENSRIDFRDLKLVVLDEQRAEGSTSE